MVGSRGWWLSTEVSSNGKPLQEAVLSSDLKTVVATWPWNSFGTPRFLPDSSGFVTQKNSILFIAKVLDGKMKPLGPMPAKGRLLGFDSAGDLLVANDAIHQGNPGEHVTITAMDLSKLRGVATYTVSVPYIPSEDLYPMPTLSPAGDRLRWDFLCSERRPILSWIDQINYYAGQSAVWHTVYVTDLRGNNLQNLGTVRFPRGHELLNARWRPDGRSFSYVDGNHVYVVPVN